MIFKIYPMATQRNSNFALQQYLYMNWKYAEIAFQQKNQGNQQTRSILIFENPFFPNLKFRCEFLRERNLDRLFSVMVNDNGNHFRFDQFSNKQTMIIIKKTINKEFKNSQVYLQDAIIKIIIKQKIVGQMPNIQLTTILNDKFFKPFITKFNKILNLLTPQLQKCLKLVGEKGLTFGGSNNMLFSNQKDKKIQELLLKLCKNIFRILKRNTKIQKDSKGERSHQSTINQSSQNHSESSLKQKNQNGGQTGTFKQTSNLFSIQELNLVQNPKKEHMGGACKVQKIMAKTMKYTQNQNTIKERNKMLARKEPRTHQLTLKTEQFRERYQRQIDIIEHLSKTGPKDYLLNYYRKEDEEDVIYMDYLDLDLNEFLFYYRQFLSVSELFSMCKQIIEIVIDLHKNGVVHRDLKPSNLLVDLSKQIKIKLIDFSDSWYVGEDTSNKNFCGTLPYSPLESSKYSYNNDIIGINKPEIDYWSVGILLHEIFCIGLPLNYTSCMAKDIHNLWTTQFLYVCNMQNKRGLSLIKSGFKLLTLLMVRVKPEERLNLLKSYQIVCQLETFYREMMRCL